MDLPTQYPASVNLFSDAIVTSEIYRLRLKRADFNSELRKLREMYDKARAAQAAKTGKYAFAAWLFTTAQFAVGYHAIYNVEWLGWDLVEPVSYSIG